MYETHILTTYYFQKWSITLEPRDRNLWLLPRDL